MAQVERTITLSPDQASYVDAQIANGQYASVSDLVQAGLRALQDQDTTVEN